MEFFKKRTKTNVTCNFSLEEQKGKKRVAIKYSDNASKMDKKGTFVT